MFVIFAILVILAGLSSVSWSSPSMTLLLRLSDAEGFGGVLAVALVFGDNDGLFSNDAFHLVIVAVALVLMMLMLPVFVCGERRRGKMRRTLSTSRSFVTYNSCFMPQSRTAWCMLHIVCSKSCGWNVRWPAREVASILPSMLFLIRLLISWRERALDDGLI